MVTGGQPNVHTGNCDGFAPAGVPLALVPAVRQSWSRIGTFAITLRAHQARDARPPQLDQVVNGADQLQFALRSCQAPQREAAKAAALDLSDDRFDRDLPLRVDPAPRLS